MYACVFVCVWYSHWNWRFKVNRLHCRCIYIYIIIRTICTFKILRHGFTSFNGRETRDKSFRRRVLSSDLINVKRIAYSEIAVSFSQNIISLYRGTVVL